MRSVRVRWPLILILCVGAASIRGGAQAADSPLDGGTARRPMRALLDAPLLFVKRHSYTGIHIYDTYYKWPPGGGGIYVLENPREPRETWRVRPIIDPNTPETLGVGVYTDPELSWDATRLLFCFKGEPEGSTSIYEIGIDGRGLRRVTDPTSTCGCYEGRLSGQHDVAPAYLPDGRIVFLSTRPSGLVPCNNTGVAVLHVMNADGSAMHQVSVNNVNEFDPSVLPDGRLLFGRWEYVDKNALTIQSLWTMNPDGTQETALYANNMVFPEAVLDARPVPGSHLIVGTFAKHNAPPRGSIALIDPRLGKNSPSAAVNLEHPEDATFDRGESCEPWPLNEDVVVCSGRPTGLQRNVLQLMDRAGRREVLLDDPDFCLHSPMLVKARPLPRGIPDTIDRRAKTGRFFVQDIYKGLQGVNRGEVKWLRVIEETSRVSASPGGANPYNQTFLLSCALAFSVKNFLGVVPVDEDGSAYFEVPAGRAVYLQALDSEGRLIQSMRTFVQAAPGVTRSCVGCHEYKYGTATPTPPMSEMLARTPHQLEPESWGSGHLDYPSMVQPVLNRHCVRCHGGQEGIAGGLDLSGGWTEHFNISYENLTSRRETQLIAHWISGIDCMNGTALWSAQLFPPRSHGSGSAPLAELLVNGHDGQIPKLARHERDLLMAWIDSNGLYHGTWDYTSHGCAIKEWNNVRGALAARMETAGCVRCHGQQGKLTLFENDWINLEHPERSRILRAPLAAGDDGWGLALCRNRPIDPRRQRLRLLRKGYAHAVQPPEAFPRQPVVPPDLSGEPAVSFASTADPEYQALLKIIRDGRRRALAMPRVDMPNAEVVSGACRHLLLPDVPEVAPQLEARTDEEGLVYLSWPQSALAVGLNAEVHRSEHADFAPDDTTLIARTASCGFTDSQPCTGRQYYAVLLTKQDQRSRPSYAAVVVPEPPVPPPPSDVTLIPASCAIRLSWEPPLRDVRGYLVYRRRSGQGDFEQLATETVSYPSYADSRVETDVRYQYVVRAVGRRGALSEPTEPIEALARIIREPVCAVEFGPAPKATLFDGRTSAGTIHGHARGEAICLDLSKGGFATLPHDAVFDLGQPLSVACRVWFDEPGAIPVVVSCGVWRQSGWFLQRLGNTWRWHVGGVDCDGGRPAEGRWIHLAATYDGQTARLFADGEQVGKAEGNFSATAWPGALHVGQYSGGPAAQYQVTGRIADVKIYHRPLDPDEVAEAARHSVPPTP